MDSYEGTEEVHGQGCCCCPVTEQSYTEPVYTEPVYTEESYTEPLYTEPVYTEPVYTEESYTEPVYTEAVHTQPVYTEPAAVAPINAPTEFVIGGADPHLGSMTIVPGTDPYAGDPAAAIMGATVVGGPGPDLSSSGFVGGPGPELSGVSYVGGPTPYSEAAADVAAYSDRLAQMSPDELLAAHGYTGAIPGAPAATNDQATQIAMQGLNNQALDNIYKAQRTILDHGASDFRSGDDRDPSSRFYGERA